MEVWFIVLFSLLMVGIIASIIALFVLRGKDHSNPPSNVGPQGPIGQTGFDGPRGPQGFIGPQGGGGSGGGSVEAFLFGFSCSSIKVEDGTSFDEAGNVQTASFDGDYWLRRAPLGQVSAVTISLRVAIFMQNPNNPQARFRVALPVPLADIGSAAITSFVGYIFTRQPGTTGDPIFLINVTTNGLSSLLLSFFQTTGNIWNNTGSHPQLDAYFKINYLSSVH